MVSQADIEFCCKLFKGPCVVNHTGNEATINFDRPYNGHYLATVNQYMTLERVMDIVKDINAGVEVSRNDAIVYGLTRENLEDELKYLTRSTKFSIKETENDYIVTFNIKYVVDRIISKKADIKDIKIMILSLLDHQ